MLEIFLHFATRLHGAVTKHCDDFTSTFMSVILGTYKRLLLYDPLTETIK
jgi:hypothetical protein